MDNTLYLQILESHKSKIGEELYQFLFDEAQPVIISDSKIVISIDDFSLNYLSKESEHFDSFYQTAGQVLFSNNFELTFLTRQEEIHYNVYENPTIPLVKQRDPLTSELTSLDIDLFDEINTEVAVETPLNVEVELPRSDSAYSYTSTNLSNNLTFENFFYSYENKQVVDAAKLIIETANTPEFNPFFLYGASGIGKTHILNAIGNELFKQYPEKNVLYLHSQIFMEEYTSLFTGGINNTNKIEEFKDKYNQIDVLLIDDIQHLESKEETIKEFFGIFEKMRNNNKIIIIASDKEPQKINFEERLITRFVSGLTCQMKIPDTNTKKEILQYHALKRDFIITDDATKLFIENSPNVRTLLGYLNAITLYSISNDIKEMKITREIALSILNNNTNTSQELTDQDIIKIIADYYKIKSSEIRGRKRHKKIVNARHFAAYFLRVNLRQKHSKIAYTLGFKDHTAAINAIKTAEDKSKKDEYIDDFENISKLLNG